MSEKMTNHNTTTEAPHEFQPKEFRDDGLCGFEIMDGISSCNRVQEDHAPIHHVDRADAPAERRCVCGHRYEQHAAWDYGAYCHVCSPNKCIKYTAAEAPLPPLRIWLNPVRSRDGYYTTGATDDLGAVEYVLLSAHNAEVARLREALIAAIEDEGDCRYDHHGYCQEHKLQPKGECYVELGRAVLRASSKGGE